MTNLLTNAKNALSRLTIVSWVIIIAVVALVVVVIVTATNSSKQQENFQEPVIDEDTGLIENVEETEPVTEDEDATGEILPDSEVADPEVDIEAEELGPPIE